MREILAGSSTWGAVLTLACYLLFSALQHRTNSFMNPLLLSAVCIGGLLLVFSVPYDDYRKTSSVLSWLLLPATVSLAIPLSEHLDLLRKNARAILAGIGCGAAVSLLLVILIAKVFRLSAVQAVSFLPKSVTTAIGAEVAAELGGISSLAIVVIILTGICGNLMAPVLCRIFRLTSPVAKGIAIGTSSHAIGTTRALQMGETEGAMSSLAMAISGLVTAILCPLAAMFLN